jgi:hypothetical protein
MVSLFERLNRGRPTTEMISERTQKIQHAQQLLNWLQRWSKPTVSARDMRIYGPRPRDRESTIDSANILVEHGWLSPIQTRRYDSHVWQVVRKPVIYPTVAT